MHDNVSDGEAKLQAPLIGFVIEKPFPDEDTGECTSFPGKVVSYDRGQCWYHVVYDDGDEEEMTPKEVLDYHAGELSKERVKELLEHPDHTLANHKRKALVIDEDEDIKEEEEDTHVSRESSQTAEKQANKSTKPQNKGKENSSPRTAAMGRQRESTPVERRPKGRSKLRVEATFNDQEMKLWEAEEAVLPKEIPRTVRVLELFAGCGGLHSDGKATFANATVRVESVAAVEVEPVPAHTYKHNYPKVNVINMGVQRFLATARRLMKLKESSYLCSSSSSGPRVLDMRIIDSEARKVWSKEDTGTTQRQDMDSVTVDELWGNAALPWLEFKVQRDGDGMRWVHDSDRCDELQAAITAYLCSPAFSSAKFPLPGDIEMVTGGPPCQGWSGYNVTRITAHDLEQLMGHKENRLLARFLEIIWVFKPLYVIMEEVPDVFARPNVMDWMTNAFGSKGYQTQHERRVTTGLYGCPQTRDRLILFAALKGLSCPEIPKPLHRHWDVDQDAVVKAFDASEDAYPIAMDVKPLHRARSAKAKLGANLPVRGLVLGDAISCDLPVDVAEIRQEKREDVRLIRHEYASEPPTPYIAFLRQGADSKHVDNHCMYKLGVSDQLRCNMIPYRRDAGWRDMPAARSDDLCYMKAPMAMMLTEEQYTDSTINDSIWSRQRKKIPEFMIKGGESGRKACAEGEMPKLKYDWELEGRRFPLMPYWCLTMKQGKDHDNYGRLWYCDAHPTVHSYHKPHWHRSLVPFAPRVLSVREKARIQGFPDRFTFLGTIGQQYKQIANAVSPQLTKSLMRSVLTAHASACGWQAQKEDALAFSDSLQTFAEFFKHYDAGQMVKLQRHKPQDVELKGGIPPLEPMTYTEIIVEYNTEFRDDHSTRNADFTPFQVLQMVEDQHMWHYERVVGLRVVREPPPEGEAEGEEGAVASKGSTYLEMCIKYSGFPEPEWYPAENGKIRDFQDRCGDNLLNKLSRGQVRGRMKEGESQEDPWTFEADEGATEVPFFDGTGKRVGSLVAYLALPGVNVTAVPGTEVEALARADAAFEVMQQRYEQDKAAGRFPKNHMPKNKRGKSVTQAKKKAKATAQLEHEHDGEDLNEDLDGEDLND